MADDEQKSRLEALERRIAAVRKGQEPRPRGDEHYSMANFAWRMVIELVAGLVIGFGIGYGLDVLFGTMPIFLVLFVLLGFAAGVKTMLRTAKEVQTSGALDMAEPDRPGNGNGNGRDEEG